jgi:hypothetical protein
VLVGVGLRHSLKVSAKELGFGVPKNEASRRCVPPNETSVAALEAHRERQNQERARGSLWLEWLR